MFLKYCVVGAACTVLDAALFMILTMAGLSIVRANPLSYGAGIILHFFLNRGWTFYEDRVHAKPVGLHRLIIALVWGFTGIWISTGLIYLAAPFTGAVIAKITSIPVMIILNFAASRYVIFRPVVQRP